MWCSACNKEHKNSAVCPDCGAALLEKPSPEWGRFEFGRLLKDWPLDAGGEYIEPAFLTTRSGLDFDAEAVVGMLGAFGIPCLQRYPNNGEFGKLIMGVPGTGVDLYVPATMLEDAKALLEGEPDDDEL